MKPRCLMIIHQFRPITNGAELQAERLAVKLAGLGHGMGVLTEHRVLGSLREETIGGVRVRRVPFRLAYSLLRGDIPRTFRYLVKNRRSYDILHVHQAFGHAVAATVVARTFGKKCIVKIACAGEYGDLHVFSRFVGAGWGLRVLRNADAIVAISREVEAELIQWGFPRDRIVRIPNGVDTAAFERSKPYPPRDPVRFVLIGRRHPQKGIDVVLEAARILKTRSLENGFEIKLYGTDYPDFDYRGMAEAFGVTDVVEFLPHQDGIRDVLEATHCLLLPSRGEGLSNALLEAMAMEIPVVATAVSGTVDVIEDGVDGLLIPVESPAALAEAMTHLIAEPKASMQLGRNARKKILSEFSLDSVADRYSKLYERLCLR